MTVFFGTSPRSALFLESSLKNGLTIDLIVSQPPKLLGKKQLLTTNQVVLAAENQKIPFILNLAELKNYQDLELGLIFDYNQIIPSSIIAFFKKGIINVHFSKLPQYKGPAPVQYTILNHDSQAWISYYLINEKLDQGQMLKQTSLDLALNENTQDLYQKLIAQASGEIKTIIKEYLAGEIKPQPQSAQGSITHKLTIQNTQIDWTKTPLEIDCLIRAAYPEPGAWTNIQLTIDNLQFTKRLKIIKAHLENNQLILDQVQLEGKNPVSFKQFKEGYPKVNLLPV